MVLQELRRSSGTKVMNSDTDPHCLEVLYKDLALALGDAVWAFARIEWVVHEDLGRLSVDRVDQLVGDLAFRARTSILIRIVERRDTSAEARARALNSIKEAEKLADKRNIIVHNPWRIWIDLNAKEFMTEIQKYSNRDRKVDLNELRQFAKTAGKIERELKESLSAL